MNDKISRNRCCIVRLSLCLQYTISIIIFRTLTAFVIANTHTIIPNRTATLVDNQNVPRGNGVSMTRHLYASLFEFRSNVFLFGYILHTVESIVESNPSVLRWIQTQWTCPAQMWSNLSPWLHQWFMCWTGWMCVFAGALQKSRRLLHSNLPNWSVDKHELLFVVLFIFLFSFVLIVSTLSLYTCMIWSAINQTKTICSLW